MMMVVEEGPNFQWVQVVDPDETIVLKQGWVVDPEETIVLEQGWVVKEPSFQKKK